MSDWGATLRPVARRGLHFLALMSSEEADDCSGLWLLLDREPPTV